MKNRLSEYDAATIRGPEVFFALGPLHNGALLVSARMLCRQKEEAHAAQNQGVLFTAQLRAVPLLEENMHGIRRSADKVCSMRFAESLFMESPADIGFSGVATLQCVQGPRLFGLVALFLSHRCAQTVIDPHESIELQICKLQADLCFCDIVRGLPVISCRWAFINS